MAVNWQILATAVVCRLEFEHLCDRGHFLDESALVRTCVEHLQTRSTYAISAEVHHPDLPEKQRLDATGRDSHHAHYDFVLEAKWLKSGGGTRDLPKEITHDILRLEMLSQADAAEQGANGRCNVEAGVIRVAGHLGEEYTVLALLHEFGHAFQAGFAPDRGDADGAAEREDDFVDAAAKGLVALMQDEPELMHAMVGCIQHYKERAR